MKLIFTYFFIILCFKITAQNITVSGKVITPTNLQNIYAIDVIKNDTVYKSKITDIESMRSRFDLFRDSIQVYEVKNDGTFFMSGNADDSLFFSGYSFYKADTLLLRPLDFKTQVFRLGDLAKRDTVVIRMEIASCIHYPVCEEPDPSKRIIFIGERISVTYPEEPYYCNKFDLGILNPGYMATYKIIKAYGDYNTRDTIQFMAYYHVGWPSFAEYKNVFLTLDEYCGRYILNKSIWYDVYKAKNGKWAIPGDYNRKFYNSELFIQSKKIDFPHSVNYDLKKFNNPYILSRFPSPYYLIKDNMAFPVMGNYVDEIVKKFKTKN